MVSAARCRGRTHDRCDDRFYFARKNGWTVAALCDGAGSKALSSEGAKIASRTVCDLLPGMLESENPANTLRDIPLRIRMAICLQYFPVLGLVNIGDFAGTLLFVARREEHDEWIVGHLGDGVVAAIDADGLPGAISHPQNGEFANVTYFYTDADADQRLRLFRVTGVRGVALMSDGTAHSLYRPADRTVSGAIGRLFEWQKTNGQRKGSSIIRQNISRLMLHKTEDDCSLILVQNQADPTGPFCIKPL